ncbi:homogentisate solanesyltransferase [Marchantia polymorpha subsp. ruderalis]|nr:hypothetical protein MARPO_0082s0042 [Marchantia polymorpha]BBN02446.1 hypothetical protein Mp_2g15440 [Marchantia polymorpha subsp. ruderalis]|eukprot:PTQ34195.1 hypothetical protein MARPO_0082s0042 [Marchantia polymorpha]
MASSISQTLGAQQSRLLHGLPALEHFTSERRSANLSAGRPFQLRVNSELRRSIKSDGGVEQRPWGWNRRSARPKRGESCRTISVDREEFALHGVQPMTLADVGVAFAQEKVARLMEEIATYQVTVPRKVQRMKEVLRKELTDEEVPFHMKVHQFQAVFWRFLRPHTIRGMLIGASAVVVRALLENTELVNLALLPKAFRGILALVCGNAYIVGINQIYDVQSDRINKPFLPIAANELSIPAAWGLVSAFAAMGVGLVATNFGPAITALYVLGLFLGGIYSFPPLHLKKFPVPAFLIIATVRGFLLNFGVYHATVAALSLPFKFSPAIIFITGFVTVFAIVIAITKDLADVEGDRRFGQRTFASRLGVRNTAFLGSGLLLANYIGAIAATIYVPGAFNQNLMVLAHACLGLALIYQTWLLESAEYSREGVAAFYRAIWNLFYTEYALLPFI